jgi:hypothetical protein
MLTIHSVVAIALAFSKAINNAFNIAITKPINCSNGSGKFMVIPASSVNIIKAKIKGNYSKLWQHSKGKIVGI